MIKRVFEVTAEIAEFLSLHREKAVMISALIETYGLKNNVYSLWTQLCEEDITAVIGIYGDGMCICTEKDADMEELADFIVFSEPSSVTLTQDEDSLFSYLNGFTKNVSDLLVMRRGEALKSSSDSQFICTNPSLSNVHSLMKEYLKVSDRDTFVCDMQARLNHGTGKAITAEIDGNTAATACVFFESEYCGFLGGISTDEKYRGRGLATALVSSLCSELINKNKTPMLSCVNPAAKRLYMSLGFEETGKRITYVKERL